MFLKILEPNTEGRDFVIGDLHGALPVFQNLLKNLAFNPAKDRMISVGDLVDRGPDSLGCLRLLNEPWFHAVLSNHEQMMLEAFRGGYSGQFWFRNGGGWGLQAFQDQELLRDQARGDITAIGMEPKLESLELFSLLDKVQALPYLITIKRPDGKKFHVIHAELPPLVESDLIAITGSTITDETLSDPHKVKQFATTTDEYGNESFLWSRAIFGPFHSENLSNEGKIKRTLLQRGKFIRSLFKPELSHIISGHTILQRPMTVVGQTNIDTEAYGSCERGASKWKALTCVELGSWSFYQANETLFRTVQPLVITADDLIHK